MGFCPELARPLGAPVLIVQAGGLENVLCSGVRVGGRTTSPRLGVRTLGGVVEPRSGALLNPPTPQSSRG